MNASDIFLLHPFPSARERCLRSAPSAPSPVPSSCPPIITAPLPLSQKFYPPLPQGQIGVVAAAGGLTFLSAAGRPQRGLSPHLLGSIFFPLGFPALPKQYNHRMPLDLYPDNRINLPPGSADLSEPFGDLSPRPGDLSERSGDLSAVARELSPRSAELSASLVELSARSGDLSAGSADLSPSWIYLREWLPS